MFLKHVLSQTIFKGSVYRQIFMTAFILQLIGFAFTFLTTSMEYQDLYYIKYYSSDTMFTFTFLSIFYFAILINLAKQREQSLFFVTNGFVEVCSAYIWVMIYSTLSALLFALAPFAQRTIMSVTTTVYENEHTLTIAGQWLEFRTTLFYYLLLATVVMTSTLFVQWKRVFLLGIVALFCLFFYGLFTLDTYDQAQTHFIEETFTFFFDLFLTESNPWLFSLKLGGLCFALFTLGFIPAAKGEVQR
ncbi:hypothetical protein JCM19046_3960 [Bacillus sp. JCM 19046]|nr:hypothetical protein JCM19045_3414 [Bacillus sp. JCM 19045]GAF19316.1 hypothetical protein JCM19046_3960 [Bacillus sp. JCM 19046]